MQQRPNRDESTEEFAVRLADGTVTHPGITRPLAESLSRMRTTAGNELRPGSAVVRRSLGPWEEVKD